MNRSHPNREAARKFYVKKLGRVTNKELSEKFGVSPSQISKWKKSDKWTEALEKRRGAPLGNKNAVGAGAPARNLNAEKHGAYSTVYIDNLTDEQKQLLDKLCGLDTVGQLNYELQVLFLKEQDLLRRISELQTNVVIEDGEEIDNLHLDRKIIVESERGASTTSVNVSTFQRITTLENELDRVHGRILRVLKALTDHEYHMRSQNLAERHYALQKQKLTGVFNYNERGELVDDYDDIDDDTID